MWMASHLLLWLAIHVSGKLTPWRPDPTGAGGGWGVAGGGWGLGGYAGRCEGWGAPG
jgi:hypothetical protein